MTHRAWDDAVSHCRICDGPHTVTPWAGQAPSRTIARIIGVCRRGWRAGCTPDYLAPASVSCVCISRPSRIKVIVMVSPASVSVSNTLRRSPIVRIG